MAETYKGLTIRIGGDTTGLQKSLKSVTSSISATENQLRRMKNALNMDSGNVSAINKTLDLMGNRAVETSQKLVQLKRSLAQIGDQKVDLFGGRQSTQTVKELADLTADANQRAAQAKEAYADITKELAKYYRPINDAVNETKKLDTVAGTADDAIKQLADEYTRLTGNKKFNAGDFITSSGDEDMAIQQLRELGLISDETADKLVNLREKYRQAFDENETAKVVAQYKDGQVELERLGAEVSNVTKRFSEMSRAAMSTKYGQGIDTQLGHIESAARSLESELKQIDDALKFDPHNVDLLAQKMRDLQEASNLAQAKVDVLDQKLERLRADGADELADSMSDIRLEVERTAQAYDEATAEVKELEGAIRDLEHQQSKLDRDTDAGKGEYERLEKEIDSARTALKQLTATQEQAEAAFKSANMAQEYVEVRTEASRARAEVSRFNDKMQEMRRFSGVTAGSLTSLGMSLSTSVTPTLLAAGYGMVESARDIDSAYRDMRKTVNGTESDFEELRQAAIDFSTTNVTSADQMLSIQAIGGELGVATEDLKEFAETVSNLDVATDLNAEDAATALGQLQNILHLTGEELAPFSDAIVRLGNNGASTESQIVDIAKRIGSMGAIVGMSAPDILAWASAIASTGQNAEAAGTAISNTMSDIEGAVSGGGDALEAFAQVSQMSAEEFARTWNTDPTEAMKAFIEGLNTIEENGGSADATLSELGITAARQRQAIEGLMQTVDGLDDSLEMSSNAFNGVSDQWGEAGDAAREAQAKAEGFSGSLSRLENIAQALGAELGESLVPFIDGVADFLGDLFEQFEKMPDSTKQTIVAIGGVVAALGPMILLGKGISEFFGGLADGLIGVSTAAKAAKQVKSVAGAFELVKTGASGLAGVLKGGLVAGGITLAIGGVAALVKAFQDEQRESELTERATKGLSEACSVAREGMTNAADATETYTEQIYDARDATDETRESLAQLADDFDEINREASIDLDGLRRAESAVYDFEGSADLTAQEVGEFKSAIQQLNDQCGTNYEVVRDASGAYYVMEDGVRKAKDEIYQLIDAQREQVIAAAQNKKLEALYEEQYDALEKYNEVSADYTKALQDQEAARQRYVDKYGVDPTEGINKGIGVGSQEANEWASASQAASQLNTELSQHQEMLDGLDRDIDKVNASLGNLEDVANGAYEGIDKLVMSKLNSTFEGDTDVMLDFADALEQAGFSTEYLSSLSDTELVDLANAWKSTGGDIEEAMELAGLAVSENFEGIRDKLRSMSDTDLTGFLSNVDMTVDEFATAMERAGISSEQFGQVSSEAFQFMLQNCGGDLDKLMFMIQNYNSTPIADKNGNITADTVQLRDAQGLIYTWNGTNLKDQHGNIYIQRTEFEDVNGEIYYWNNSGDLVDKSGNVVVDGTQLQLVNGEIATYNETTKSLDAEGTIYVNDLEVTDAYNNVVKLDGDKLVTSGLDGEVRVNYDEVLSAQSAVDKLMVNDSATKTLNVVTKYSTIGTASKYPSGSTPAFQSLGPTSGASGGGTPVTTWPSTASTLAAKAAAMNNGVSLMSAEATKAARSIAKAPWSVASTAAEVARSTYGESAPGNRRALGSSESIGEVINNYYDVTVDGNGTTSRIEGIVLDLLDELHRLGRV